MSNSVKGQGKNQINRLVIIMSDHVLPWFATALLVLVSVGFLFAWVRVDRDHFVQLLIPTATFCGVIVAVFSIWMNSAINLRNKRLDVIMHCNLRYADLYRQRLELQRRAATAGGVQDVEVESYFKQYWALKSDQLDYWLAGAVDPETICSWFISTLDLVTPGQEQTSAVGETTLRQSWLWCRRYHEIVNPRFMEIVDAIINISDEKDSKLTSFAKIHNLFVKVERGERELIRLLGRVTPFRVSILDNEATLSSTLQIEITRLRNGIGSVSVARRDALPDGGVNT